jgi:hypothetical protein
MKAGTIDTRLRSALFFTLFIFLSHFSSAQNAPVTTAATVTGALPGPVAVPVSVINFANIGAISLTIDYDYTVMHFLQGTPNPVLVPFTVVDSDLGNGYHRLTMGWFGQGKTLADGSVIMTLSFTFIGGSTALTWFDDGSSCEYADGSYNVLNDVPQSSYYINGYVCGILPNPGPISGDSSVCEGQPGVYYSVAPLAGASWYAWTVPPGAVITGGGSTYWIIADYPAGATSGLVTVAGMNLCVTGPASQLPVTVNPLPIANAGNDTTIPYGTSTYLHAASGGTGSFGYHWSPEYLLIDPNVQDPQTVLLTSTNVFTVLVTNLATQCQNSDEMVVFVSGGPLNVNPVAEPDSVCRGTSSQLYANPGGGSGAYSYDWTCIPPGDPPWTSSLANPVVAPDTTTQYLLTVFDGFNTAGGFLILTVTPVPGAPVIQLNDTELSSDTCCGNQWYRDGIAIPGAVGQYYTVPASGIYFDVVTVNGCYSDTSNMIDVILTGIETAKPFRKLLLYPNPVYADCGRRTADGGLQTADGRLHLIAEPVPDGLCHLRVFDMNGKSVLEKEKVRFYPGEPFGVSISGLGPGMYVLVLQTEEAPPMRSVFLVR